MTRRKTMKIPPTPDSIRLLATGHSYRGTVEFATAVAVGGDTPFSLKPWL